MPTFGNATPRTRRRGLLDRILILNDRHLALVLHEYLIHYNRRRPRRSRAPRPVPGPIRRTAPARLSPPQAAPTLAMNPSIAFASSSGASIAA